jgi:solute carrier family 25 uncoupling protein 8/9
MSLWSGLSPAVARGFFYGGVRLGLYEPCKQVIASLTTTTTTSTGGPKQPGFAGKLLAGSASGGLAAAITNPTELVKVSCDGGSRGGTWQPLVVWSQRGPLNSPGGWAGDLTSLAAHDETH